MRDSFFLFKLNIDFLVFIIYCTPKHSGKSVCFPNRNQSLKTSKTGIITSGID